MGILKLHARGQVSIFKITNNKKELIKTCSNTVLPLALDVVARLMGNFAIGKIDSVSAYKSSLSLAETPIISYSHPSTNQVQFNALFSETSFSGAYDEFGLFASNIGRICALTGVSGNKLNTEQLLITWTITIS